MSHHLIEILNLRHVYPDGTVGLEDVSFRAEHGESIALLGANGSGKSTLLLHLNGTLLPSSGEVRVGDIPVLPSTLDSIRRTVGMVFQNPDDQLFMPTAREDVAFGPINMGLPPDEVEKRVQNALAETGLLAIREKAPYRLSGGEKRSLSIATVLSMEPDILVMDEPNSNLDCRARRSLINLLNQFSHTKIIATHDLAFARETCARTIILKDGKIAADGATESLFDDADLMTCCHLEL